MKVFANFPFFLPEHMFPATTLAWQNGPGICMQGKILEKPHYHKFSVISYLQINFISLSQNSDNHSVRTKYYATLAAY